MVRFATHQTEKEGIYFKSDLSLDEVTRFIENMDDSIINREKIRFIESESYGKYYKANVRASHLIASLLVNKYSDSVEPIAFSEWVEL